MMFPLLPYSKLVLDMLGTVPGVYDIPVLLRARAEEVDMARLETAVRAAIRNHPVLSMRLDAEGHHDCALPDEFHGQHHCVSIFEDGGFVYLKACFNRILGDMVSLLVLADDVSRAYRGLELEPDAYREYLKNFWERQNAPRSIELNAWLDGEFGALTCPVRPHTDAPPASDARPASDAPSVSDAPPASDALQRQGIFCDTIPFSEAVLHREHVTPSGFVSLCAALAIMDYEGTDSAALTWAYAGRDSLEEQRVFGSLHKDIPFAVRRSGSPAELFRQARRQLRSGISHSDCPYTLTPPHTDVWNYAVNVLEQPDLAEVLATFPFPLEALDPTEGAPQVAYSLLDIELSQTADGSLDLLYRYSAAHYRPESIARFASLVRSNAGWLLGGHQRQTRGLEEMIAEDAWLAALVRHSIDIAAGRCPDRRMNPVRSLDDLFAFLDRFLVSRPWESLGLQADEMPLFRRIDQSTGYFLYLFDQPLPELEGRGYLYPSVQYVPKVAEWIRRFNDAWREYLDSPASWDALCLELLRTDPLFGLDRGWYEPSENWHCWNDFFSRRLSGPDARPVAEAAVTAPADGILQTAWKIGEDSCIVVPESVRLKTASVRSVADLLGGSPFRDAFAGGLFVHQTLDFYDYHRFHSPVDGTVLDLRLIPGISGSGGVVEWDSARGRYAYANPGEPGFQMLETRGVAVFDAGRLGLVALVAVGMAQVCSVNWQPGLAAGVAVRRGDELGHFLCGGSDVVLLFQKGVDLQLIPAPGRQMLMGEGMTEM